MPSSAPASPAGEMPEAADSFSLKSECPAAGLSDRWLVPGVCLFLAAMVWAVFGQTLHHEFVNYDDDVYVYDNLAVNHGLNLEGVEWAFTHIVASNWHPLTMLSHMLDCQLYGLKAGGHHLTNVLLHTASVILLFLVLRRMTGYLWRSALVAAVFAIHPLRVESVAWVAERKDVLSGLFFMLTLWAYTRYAQGRSRVQGRALGAQVVPALASRPWLLDYCLVLLFFALGLLCKPMLVTLPLVLLLLDYWPLRRISELKMGLWPSTLNLQLPGATKRSEGGSPLLLEKLPLFGLAAASCVVTIFAQHEAFLPFEQISLPLRVGNALISYVAYLGQMFWPAGLAVFYPFTAKSVGVSEVVLSLVLLAGISTGVFILRRRCPYFLTGWLWYLIMLVPVIGIVQVGSQARADRYTYLPQIGLYLMLAWGVAEGCAGWRHRRAVLGGFAAIILVVLVFCARTQTSCWRNSESLWTHAIACTSDNYIGHNNLGNALLKEGKVDEAIAHFQKVLQIKPGGAEAHNNLGNALLQKGNLDEAITHFQKALEINPDSAQAHNNLGNVLLKKGRVDEAIIHYQTALQLMPNAVEAHINLGGALLQMGKADEAIVQYQTALEIKPGSLEAHINLGNALLQKGGAEEAITHFQKALQIKPDSLVILNNLAWLLATSPDAHVRDGAQAVQYAEHACELTHYGVTLFVGTLAAAYAEAGRYDNAVATAQKACALAEKSGDRELLERNQKLLALYRVHQPYHEPGGEPVPARP
jgi:Flp pilus assembly protein TadD